MSVNPTKTDLKTAYSKHSIEAKKTNNLSSKLLWFYAAECGLKSYYLKINNLKDAESGDLQKKFSHKLSKLVKECNLPNISEPDSDNGKYPIKEFHEYMRYGVSLPNTIENNQLNYIKKIVEILNNKI